MSFISLEDIAVRMLRMWKFGLLMLAVTIGLAYLIYKNTAQYYIADSTVIVWSQDSTGGAASRFAALAGVGLPLSSNNRQVQTVEFLKSRRLAMAFIEQRNLTPKLFEKLWDETANRWTDSQNIPSEWQTFQYFDNKVRTVGFEPSTGVITIKMKGSDGSETASWANGYVDLAMELLREEAVNDAQNRLEDLTRIISESSVANLRNDFAVMVSEQMKQTLLLNAQGSESLRVIDPAVAPEEPQGPSLVLILAVSLAAYGFIYFLIALIRLRKERRGSWDETADVVG